jgi:hypothetical protein
MPVAATNTTMIVGLASVGVLVWLFCAFSTASLARTNGRSYNLWLLVGLLTGPLGLGFSYLYYRVTGERYRRTRYGEGHHYDIPEMVRCPSCNESVPRSFESCQFCGAPLHRGRRH